MQILVANVAKSLRNLEALKDHIQATMDPQRPFVLAVIEPPPSSLNPSVDLVLQNFLDRKSVV